MPGSSGWWRARRRARRRWRGWRIAGRFGSSASRCCWLAAWAATGDAVRGLAVLVVATPCPLILAVPVAIIAGLSRAAGAGVLVKSGGALESMARARVLLLDKTGTLTIGHARLSAIRPENGIAEEEVLRLAASLDQASGHVLAQALVEAATARGLALSSRSRCARRRARASRAGRRISDGHRQRRLRRRDDRRAGPGGAGGRAAGCGAGLRRCRWHAGGVLVFEDPIRPDAPAMLAGMRRAGSAAW